MDISCSSIVKYVLEKICFHAFGLLSQMHYSTSHWQSYNNSFLLFNVCVDGLHQYRSLPNLLKKKIVHMIDLFYFFWGGGLLSVSATRGCHLWCYFAVSLISIHCSSANYWVCFSFFCIYHNSGC